MMTTGLAQKNLNFGPKKLKEIQSCFGLAWEKIICGNKMADLLTQQPPNAETSPKLSFHAQGLKRFVLTDAETNFTIVENSILSEAKI